MDKVEATTKKYKVRNTAAQQDQISCKISGLVGLAVMAKPGDMRLTHCDN